MSTTHSPEGIRVASIVNTIIPNSSVAAEILGPALASSRPGVWSNDKIKQFVNFTYAKSIAPIGINISAFLGELMRLNSEIVWHTVFERTTTDTAPLQSYARRTGKNLAASISDHNKFLFGFSPTVALAAVYGRQLVEPTDDEQYLPLIIHTTAGDLGPWTAAFIDAQAHFREPITTQKELMSRMQELFPTREADNMCEHPYSLYNILVRNNVFAYKNGCIVMHPALYLFEAFGQAIRSDYGENFEKAVFSH